MLQICEAEIKKENGVGIFFASISNDEEIHQFIFKFKEMIELWDNYFRIKEDINGNELDFTKSGFYKEVTTTFPKESKMAIEGIMIHIAIGMRHAIKEIRKESNSGN